jgi:carbon monoxide dehydrogenase subunit G
MTFEAKDGYFCMKLNGTHKFRATSAQVYNAILNPSILRNCIPGCDSVEYLDANRIKANVTTPLPGLKGPYGVVINIQENQPPNRLVLQVQRKGTGGSIQATSDIRIIDESDGALLSYDARAHLEGAVAIANNPLGQGITKSSLNAFFKNLDKAIV